MGALYDSLVEQVCRYLRCVLDLLISMIRELFGDEQGLGVALSHRKKPTAGGFLAKAKAQAARRREQGK